MKETPIHFAVSAILGLPGTATSWRIAACSARVDKFYTQDCSPPGTRTLEDVTCGNCLRTKAYKEALDKERDGLYARCGS